MLLRLLSRVLSSRRRDPGLAAAYALLKSNEIEKAKARAHELMRTDAYDPEVQLFAARVAYRAKQFGHAMELLRPLAERDEAELAVLQLFAKTCVRAGKPQEGRAALGRALRLDFGLPNGSEAHLVTALIDVVWELPYERWKHSLEAFSHYGWLLGNAGILVEAGDELLDAAASRDPLALAPGSDEDAVFATLRLLDFSDSADREYLEAAMSRVVLPWMRRAAGADRYGLALMLETQAYGNYLIPRETEEHFRRAFSLWTGFMRDAGRRAASQLPPVAPATRAGVPRVGFFLHSGSVLAHTRLLFEFLDALRDLEPRPLEPVIFHRGKASPDFTRQVAALGVACHRLGAGDEASEAYRSVLALRRHIAEQGMAALVWVSAAPHMAFAFAMRIAPVQIWWALKYHSLEFREIDGYLTAGSAGATKRVAGKLWRSAPLAAADWYRPELAGRAAQVRAGFAQHDLLFACLGREEKLNSEPFLDAVARVLHACPRAGFLWTGRQRLPAIEARLKALGIADRCHFIGWVDTKLYAQVIDVFLDSFPFPCAFTLYETMAAGKPVVTFASPESAETGLNGMLGPLLARDSGTPQEQTHALAIYRSGPQPLYFCAEDAREYVAFALKLAADPALRQAAGEANRTFVREFLSDRDRMARTLANHLLELIAAARQAT